MVKHGYVDESSRGHYIVCVAVVAASDAELVRRALRNHLPGGTVRLHMAKERQSRRRAILSTVCALPVSATIYVSQYAVHRDGRAEIMRRIVGELGIKRLVIEAAQGQDEHDRAVLYAEVRKAGLEDRFTHVHLSPRVEPCLWLPDVIAWAWGAGGDWRRRVTPVVGDVVLVRP